MPGNTKNSIVLQAKATKISDSINIISNFKELMDRNLGKTGVT